VQGGEFEPTLRLLTPQPGDRYLLCSDGLSDFVSDEAIEHTLLNCPDPQLCAERLVRLALRAGGPDNVTVIVSDVAFADVADGPGRADLSDVAAG